MWDCEFACGDGLVLGEEQTCCSAWEVLLLVLFTDLVESFQEECDDGGLEAFDGCDASCKARQFALQGRHPQPQSNFVEVEPGFVCDGAGKDAPSMIEPQQRSDRRRLQG